MLKRGVVIPPNLSGPTFCNGAARKETLLLVDIERW